MELSFWAADTLYDLYLTLILLILQQLSALDGNVAWGCNSQLTEQKPIRFFLRENFYESEPQSLTRRRFLDPQDTLGSRQRQTDLIAQGLRTKEHITE